MICRYCGDKAKFVNNEEIYGKRYGKSYKAWWCKKCDARIGVHENDPKRPLGKNLACKSLRSAKVRVKNLFIDTLLEGSWKCTPYLKKRAYCKISPRSH